MAKKAKDKIVIYTDGACSGNPGPGGWGSIIAFPNSKVIELGGGSNPTTNNQMELTAVLESLKLIKEKDEEIWIFTDSTYVIRGITQWIWGWKKRAWVTSEGKPVSNKEIWEPLSKQVNRVSKSNTLSWKYVRGHQGIPGNERCDEIAVKFSQGDYVELYKGSLKSYSIDIYSFPKDTSLPPMKSGTSNSTKEDVTYLSYLDGKLEKHDTWKECEARVKGRSGAKFKKVKSPLEEKEILKSWGLKA